MFQADDGPPDPLMGPEERRNLKQDSIADLSPSKRIVGSLASHFRAIRDIFFRRWRREDLFVSGTKGAWSGLDAGAVIRLLLHQTSQPAS